VFRSLRATSSTSSNASVTKDVDIEAVSYDRGRGRGLVTGYRVRLAGKESERWYGGGRIAKDLTLPALRASGNWPTLRGDQPGAWADAATRVLTQPDQATVTEAKTALAELRQRLTEVDVNDRVAWAHVARDAAGMLNAISLRTEPEPGPLADAGHVIAASATINRTNGDRRRWLGRGSIQKRRERTHDTASGTELTRAAANRSVTWSTRSRNAHARRTGTTSPRH